MPAPFWKKLVIAATATTLVIAAISVNSIGQEKKADSKAKAGAKEKPKGRLPAYYKDIVTEEQKEQIYAIQAKHAKQIEDLQSQLEAARAKLNDEIEALLSAEQKEKLAKAKAEADAKKKSSKKTAEAKTAEAKPAEPAKTTTESPKKTK